MRSGFSNIAKALAGTRRFVKARRWRCLLFESLEIRTLLATDSAAPLSVQGPFDPAKSLGPNGSAAMVGGQVDLSTETRSESFLSLLGVGDQQANAMKAAMSEQLVVGLEDRVAGELLEVYREYAAAYTQVDPSLQMDAEAIAAAVALPDDSILWTQSAESRVGVRVVIADDSKFSTTVQNLSLLGYEEFASDSAYLLTEGSLPVWAIPEASNLSGVAALDVIYDPVRHTGSVTTQADAAMNADDVRSGAGAYTGTGVKVGIMSDSANRFGSGLAASQATGDLPGTIDMLRDGPTGSADEGRAMMELVHDIAPGASLAFRSANWGELDFARGIHELADAGADVIVDDIGYYSEPAFADGPIAQAVDHVVNTHGVAYFSAAGNQADKSWESTFRDNAPGTWSTTVAWGSGNNLHDFDSTASTDVTLRVTVPADTVLTLQWDQPWYTVSELVSDFDFYVFSTSGTLITSSTRNSTTFRMPYEIVSIAAAGTYDLQINHVSGPEAVRLKILAWDDTVTFNEYSSDAGKGTITGHAAANGAAAVAAASYSTYTGSGTIQSFSSRGQPTIYFDSQYRRLATPESRNKPDFTAADGGNTTFFYPGGDDGDADLHPNFRGTSAAAPDAAAVAALVLQQRPSLSPAQVYQVLANTATDRGTSGWDKVYGAGNIDAWAASTALNTPSNFADTTGPLATEFSVQAYGTYPVDKFTVWFNEELNSTAAGTAANYEIRNSGADAAFGTGDDSTFSLTATYTDATRSVVLDPSGTLNQGRYRVTLKAGAAALRDTTGNQLNAGTDQTYDFIIGNSDRERILDQQEYNLSWPDVAINAANQGVAVWADSSPTSPSLTSVFVQRFDATGQPIFKSPLELNALSANWNSSESTRNRVLPAAAISDDGRSVVVYEGYFNDGVSNFRVIYAQRFNADGTLLGDPIPVDTGWSAAKTDQASPDVAIMPDGSKFVVVWEDGGSSNATRRIEGIVYNWEGSAATLTTVVNTTAIGATLAMTAWRVEPAVAMDTNGNWAAAWSRFDGTSTFFTYSRRFSVSAAAQTAEILVGSGTNHSWDPDVAIDDSSKFNVVYGGSEVLVSRYNSAGTLRESAFQINTTTANSQASPAIAMERDAGDFVVVWQSGSQDVTGTNAVLARQYNSSASAVTGEYSLNQTILYNESFPAVAMDTDGDFWAVWDGYETASDKAHAIYGRWMPAWANTTLTDVTPVALEVAHQAAPGEKVDVKLTLHNPSFIASGAFAVQFYLSTDATITSADLALGSAFSVATLTPGQTRAANFTVQLPTGLALANAYLGVIVDSDGTLTESDELVDGNQSSTITVSVSDAVSDDAFDPVADQTVTVTTIDNDAAGFTIVQTGGSTSVSESGTTDTFTVVLNKKPSTNVVLNVVSNDVGEATVSAASLTFTNANWSTPQTITVTGVDDALTDGSQNFTVTVSVSDAASDDTYDLLADQLVSVSTLDNEGPGFTIVESISSTTVSEVGTTDTFTVVLNAAPASNVVLTVISSDTGEATVSAASLTFTTTNWSTPQTVTVKGINDVLVDGNQTSTITISVNDAGSDNSYDPLPDQIVSVFTLDDEPGFAIVESGISTSTNEGGITDTFTIALNAQPTSNVVITLSSGNTAEATVSPATLIFTAANWNTPQTVTVTGVNDDLNNTAAQSMELRYASHSSGAETRANTTTSGAQEIPFVAMDDQGRSVVTWSGNGTGDSTGIFFQRYNSLGQVQGAETRVNTTLTNTQSDAVVAVNKSTGDFVVAWTSDQTGGNDVYFQRFNSSGVAQGSETRANTTTSGSQVDSTIAVDDSGNFVIAWTSGSPSHILAKRFNSAGVVQGSEFQVDTSTYPGGTLDQSSPWLSMDSSGKFVVAWRSSSEEGLSSNSGIYFQRYDASGNRVGSQAHANVYTTSNQTRPTVALADDGKVIVAWASTGQEQLGTSDTASDGIYFQRFDVNNMLLSAEVAGVFDSSDVRTNSYVTGDQLLPAVAIGSDGRFALAWDSASQDGSSRGVYFRKYRADGTADGGMRQVNSFVTNDQKNPVLAIGSGDSLTITWQSTGQDGSGDGVYFQRFGMEGGTATRTEDFESADLTESYWETYSTNEGRIQLTDSYTPHSTIDLPSTDTFNNLTIQNGYGGAYHLLLDDTTDNTTFSLNEAVLHVNLAGVSKALFSFWEKAADTVGGNGDELHVMSSTFSGHENSDGVAISADGTTWYRIWSAASTATYALHMFSLDDIVGSIQASFNPTFALTTDTRIKFQQYDNSPAVQDGLLFDDIQVTVPRIWDGGGSTNNWSESTNWSGDTLPQAGDHVLFNGSSTKDSTVDSGFAGSITHLTINSGYTGTITQSRSLTLNTGGNFYQSAGTYSLETQALTLGGNFAHTAGVFNAGSGTVTFTGATGAAASLGSEDTLVVAGTLTLTDGRLLGGTLDARGNVTVGSGFDAGSTTALALAGASTQTFSLSAVDKFDGDIIINKTGGEVILTSALTMNAAGQDLTVANGTSVLNLGANNLTVADGLFSNNGTVKLQGIATQTISLTPDHDSGTWEYLGDSDGLADTFTLREFGTIDYFNLKLNLTDTNDTFQSSSGADKVIAGAFSINRGTFDANSNNVVLGSLAGAGNLTLGSTTLTTGADNTDTTFSGVISGTGGLTKNGLGTLKLAGVNTYSGATTIAAGTLNANSSAALGDGSSTNTLIFSGGTLQAGGSIASPNTRTVTMTNTGIIDTNGQSLSIGGTLSGAAGLTKNGAGTLTLSGTNTYTGATSIAAGTLNANSSAALGDGSSTNTLIFTGGTLQAANTISSPSTRTVTLTSTGIIDTNGQSVGVAGVLSGAGGLTKNGAGTLTLTGTNTYSGATTINLGTTTLSGANGTALNSAFTVAGGVLSLDNVSNNNTNRLGDSLALTLSNGELVFIGSNTASTNAAETIGSMTLPSGASTVTAVSGSGGSTILTFASASRNAGSTVLFRGSNLGSNPGANRANIKFSNATGLNLVGGNGAAGTTNINIVPYAIGDTSSSGPGIGFVAHNVDTNFDSNGIRPLDLVTEYAIPPLSNGTRNFKITGNVGLNGASISVNSLRMFGGITLTIGTTAPPDTLTITSGAVFSNNSSAFPSTITSNSSGDTLNFSSVEGIFHTVRDLNVSSVITGSQGVTKGGAATLTLSGANTYTGTTTITAGTLSYGGSNVINTGAVTVDGATAVLNLGANRSDTVETVTVAGGGSITGSGTSTLTSTGTFEMKSGTVSAILAGSVALNKTTTGTVTLTGANTYGGATTINAGSLRLGTANAIPDSSAVVLANASGATLDLNNNSETIGSLAGGGSTGGNVTLGSATLTTGLDNSDTSYGGVISGSGGITKMGAGTWILSGANTYSGTTTISVGSIKLGASGVISDSSAFVFGNLAGVTLDLNSNNETIGSLAGGGANGGNVVLGSSVLTTGANNAHTKFAGVISGTGGLTKVGTGSFYLQASNSYDGATTISDGSILVSTNNGLGTAAGGTTVAGGANARLVFERSVNYTTPEPVTINGSGINGVGALAGVGNSTFAGPISLASASTIGAYPAGYTFMLNGTIDTNGNALTVRGTGSMIVGGAVSDSGGLIKTDTNTVTLSATNSYTGTTTVNGGTLLVTGSNSASATTVNLNGTVGGTGTVGPLTVSSGMISPGTSSGTGIGILSGSTADVSAGGILRMQIQGYGTAGTDFDRLILSGALTLGGTSKLSLDLAGLSAPGVVTAAISYASVTGVFPTIELLNNGSNLRACVLSYGATSLNITIALPNGACGAWTSEGNEAGAVGRLDSALAGLRPLVATSRPVTVASLDSGVDYKHPALFQNIWINQDEIPGNVRRRIRDADRDGRVTLRDLNHSTNQGRYPIVKDLNRNGFIDGGDLIQAWSDGRDDDKNGYLDDIIGWDFLHNDNDPLDDSGHGTHAAGVIVQVAPKAEVLPLQFLDSNLVGTLANASRALDYALSKKVQISSNGWVASDFTQEWLDKLTAASAAGHLLFAAAGNGDASQLEILRRLKSSNLLVVAATDAAGELASFTNWDPEIVDLTAPGVGVLSAMPGGGYAARSGTSVATAFAAGMAALLQGSRLGMIRSELVDAVFAQSLAWSPNATSRGIVSSSLLPNSANSGLPQLRFQQRDDRTLRLAESQSPIYENQIVDRRPEGSATTLTYRTFPQSVPDTAAEEDLLAAWFLGN